MTLFAAGRTSQGHARSGAGVGSAAATGGERVDANVDLIAAAEFALDKGPEGGTLTSIESEQPGTQWEVKSVTVDGAK